MTRANQLAGLYREAHNRMRNVDGLQPQEAFDELLKYLYFRQTNERSDDERVGLRRTLNFDGGSRMGDDEAAKSIRRLFAAYLKQHGGTPADTWRDRKFHLSDGALVALHELFIGTDLGKLDLDVRSAALRLFLGPELRRGLGIYLTPDDVVRAIVEFAAPETDAVVYDPACGSGTFLIETTRYWRMSKRRTERHVYGSDLNARMLLLADLNLGSERNVEFHGQLLDALSVATGEWPTANSVDHVMTNPPFGVYIDPVAVDSSRYATANRRVVAGQRMQSEVLFIEQSLRWLKPGGLLSIVVPRSVVTNAKLAGAREVIDGMGQLIAIINLPPETFASTGTQTNTTVLFIRKHTKAPVAARVSVAVADVTNVGVDSTGRPREDSQLPTLGADLREVLATGRPRGVVRLVDLPSEALSAVANTTGGRSTAGTRRLADIVELAHTGRTPARSAYTEGGVFTIKVGNLTGQGIDWSPRERNFVSPHAVSDTLVLRDGDLLMTSSAHNPKYIAQKVDIVHCVPDFVGKVATFTGEVLRLRVDTKKCEPFALLAFLRTAQARDAIQEMVRGQTAHLRPKDLLDLPVPEKLEAAELIALLRREAVIAAELSLIAFHQRRLLKTLYNMEPTV